MVRHTPPKPPPLVELQAQPQWLRFFLVLSSRVSILCLPKGILNSVLGAMPENPRYRARAIVARLKLTVAADRWRPEPLASPRDLAARFQFQFVRARVPRIGCPGGAVILLSPVRFLFPRAYIYATAWQTWCPSVRARVRIIDCGQGRCVVGCEILSPFRAGNRDGPLRNDSGQR